MTVCTQCQAQWTGERTGHCTRCHRTFTTLGNFDAHLQLERGPGICKDIGFHNPADVTDKHGNRILYERHTGTPRAAWAGQPPQQPHSAWVEHQNTTPNAEDGLPMPNGTPNA